LRNWVARTPMHFSLCVLRPKNIASRRRTARIALRSETCLGGRIWGSSGRFRTATGSRRTVRAPLDKRVLEDLRRCVNEFDQKAAAEFANNQWAQKQNKTREPVTQETADRLFRELQDFQVTPDKAWNSPASAWAGTSYQILQKFAAHPKFEPIHLVRWCLLLSGRTKIRDTGKWQRYSINYGWSQSFLHYQQARKQPIDLRQLAAAMRAIVSMRTSSVSHGSRRTRMPVLHSCDRIQTPSGRTLPNVPSSRRSTRPNTDSARSIRDLPLREGSSPACLWNSQPVSAPPCPLDSSAVEIALGPSKTERPLAQQCLDKVPNKEERIVAAVGSKQLDARLAAAEWLANLKYELAVPALKAALGKEKSEIVRDEQIRALEALGVSLEELLDVNSWSRKLKRD